MILTRSLAAHYECVIWKFEDSTGLEVQMILRWCLSDIVQRDKQAVFQAL